MPHPNFPLEHAPFVSLPVQYVTVANGEDKVAVHISGDLGSRRVPLVCVPGFHRNMSDYAAFAAGIRSRCGEDWPVVLLDLRGRGRSTYRRNRDGYSSILDAADLSVVATALGIDGAIFVGQSYGGQVIMALAAQRPALIAGTILVDAGPVSDPRGLVRLRNNLRHIDNLRGEAALRRVFRQILAVDYPGLPEDQLDRLALRTHWIDSRGRPHALFDRKLVRMLDAFEHDDILVAQWSLFTALDGVPMMIFRSQLSDQLRRETFDEMARRRPDAITVSIMGQGSPALLDQNEEQEAVADFLRHVGVVRGRAA